MPAVDGLPWPFCNECWCDRYGNDIPPWAESATTANTSLSQADLGAVKAYALEFLARVRTQNSEAFPGHSEGNFVSVGRRVATDWLSQKLITWELTQFLDEQIEQVGLSVYKVTNMNFTASVPTDEVRCSSPRVVQLPPIYLTDAPSAVEISGELLGNDAFTPSPTCQVRF